MSSKNNKKSKSKSDQNHSATDIPDAKTNTSTSKTAVHRQGAVDGTIHDN